MKETFEDSEGLVFHKVTPEEYHMLKASEEQYDILYDKMVRAVKALEYIASEDREGSTLGYWEMKEKAFEALEYLG